MQKTAEVVIPQMFTAYAEDLGYLENGLHHFQYYCESCGQAFTSAWGKAPGATHYEKGRHFHCPYCGMRHADNAIAIGRNVQAPNKIRLSVKTYKSIVILEINSSIVQFRDLLRVYGGKYKERFRFNLAKRTTTFTRYNEDCKVETLEIGNPFKLEFLSKSILKFFIPYSLIKQGERMKFNELLKTLRESVHERLEKQLGYKIPSMYVSPGSYYGMFLLPIMNMAYRVMLPDAPNLPAIYRNDQATIGFFWKARLIEDHSFMDEAITLAKKSKKAFVTALAEVRSLPDKPAIRKILNGDPFDVVLLKKAFELCQNYDYAVRMFARLKELGNGYQLKTEQFKFLEKMRSLYGEAGIVHMVEDAIHLRLWDCFSLYNQLNPENREAIKTEQVRIKDLHDWMVIRHRRQEHKNLKFEVPEPIIRRLSMQTDRLKFFMPKESMELLEAGMTLHNCVASYGKAMKDNSSWVVLVADDKGKLSACLEVQGRKLVQAKIDKNKPAANDPKLNSEILAWAKGAGLQIKTGDLKIEDTELVQEAV